MKYFNCCSLLRCRPLNSETEWKWKSLKFCSSALIFAETTIVLFLYMERGPWGIFWLFSEFIWILEHPERSEIVILLNAWVEQILGDETSLLSSSVFCFVWFFLSMVDITDSKLKIWVRAVSMKFSFQIFYFIKSLPPPRPPCPSPWAF